MQIGVIGLGTMGANLARNAARNGAEVSVFNRTAEKVEEFMKSYAAEGTFVPCATLANLCSALKAPRAILLMVKAGEAVETIIAELTPLLSKGDILIDGGNSHYRDTERRQEALRKNGMHFIGMGVSGGEEGALRGPSMMPGGNREAYEILEPLLQKMAAEDSAGGKCVTYLGGGGSGHFVKMVHNGIEYALMQLIAEAYHLLKSEGGLRNEELAETFAEWNKGEDLQSFLMEISAKILKKKDPLSSSAVAPLDSPLADARGSLEESTTRRHREAPFLLDLIKDAAEQKGTGKWTTDAAMHYGVSIPTITAAVDARIVSGAKDFRMMRSKQIAGVIEQPYPKHEKLISRVRIALELSIINAYAQGFQLLSAASEQEKWNLNISEIARIWRGGCIIRSALLSKFQEMFKGKEAAALEVRERFSGERQLEWRRAVALGIGRGIPLPAMSASLAYFDSYRSAWLPQNLVQAQRDFFGAHGFERMDKTGTFHAKWE